MAQIEKKKENFFAGEFSSQRTEMHNW